jgi:hypothetical protein
VSQVVYYFSLRHPVTSSVLLPWEQKIQIFKNQKIQELHIPVIFAENLKCVFPSQTEAIDH